MDVFVGHIQEHLVPYIVLGVGLSIFIFATRRYSIPIIQYCLEVVIYCGIMHIVVWGITSGAAAFKRASSFKALAADREMEARWTTPILHFWKLDEYDPSWIWKIEVVVVAIIIFLVWRIRPMKIQKPPRPRTIPGRRSVPNLGARTTRNLGRVGGRRR